MTIGPLLAQPLVRTIETKSNLRISFTGQVTALAFRSLQYVGDSYTLQISGKEIKLPLDPDAPDFTYFVSISPQEITSMKSPEDGTLYLINSGKPPSIPQHERLFLSECDEPPYPISQSEWRADLPAPNYSRSFTDVKHIIVHHSAGSNSNTNYTQVIRDIYLYHTQTNGWSDIGYNYVIAQNGDLYAVRDPAGGAQDNVIGAHFCGRNSTTMGICVLGNYETAEPSTPAIQTLQHLVTWKIRKEQLDPLGSSSHPFGDIGHIAGHRDGCATLCPGEHLYEMLPTLRYEAGENTNNCEAQLDMQVSSQTINAGESIWFTNLSTGFGDYEWEFEGGSPYFITNVDSIEVTYELPGTYSVTLTGRGDSNTDSRIYENIIRVRGATVVYPNPVNGYGEITLASDTKIEQVEIYSIEGKMVNFFSNNPQTIVLQGLKTGVYSMKIILGNQSTTRRLVVK